MKSWGFNFVRLGLLWDAYEKQPNVWDHDYAQKVEDIVNMLGKAGIYTLVDMHQDAGSRRFCGEGIPDFYGENVETKCEATPLGRWYKSLGNCKAFKDYNVP